jgi:uncharacterized lipoprotein YddW (UPF0748 family)
MVKSVVVSVAAVALVAALPLLAQDQPPEVRALWVQRASLTSPTSILSLVETARDAGFNTLIVQVRGRGDAYYTSRFEPRAVALSKQPVSFDPLEMAVAAGHRAGLQVHAWVNVNLVSDAAPSTNDRHLVHTRPEWLMVPRDLALELRDVEKRSARYLERLSRYARAHSDRIEGLYLSPLQPAAVDHTVKVMTDVASRYDVDGIHLDYIRFPNPDFDYGEAALAQFRSYLLPQLTSAERRQFDARARGEPLFYTETFPQRWQDFRRERVTSLVTRLRAAVKSRRPRAVLSAAVFPDPTDASTRRFQDWPGWIATGLLDVVCPMAYTTDRTLFRSQIAGVKQVAGPQRVWAGIGAFRLSPAETTENIRAARQSGAEGIILFSYDNLNRSYLSTVAEEAFAR